MSDKKELLVLCSLMRSGKNVPIAYSYGYPSDKGIRKLQRRSRGKHEEFPVTITKWYEYFSTPTECITTLKKIV